MKRHFHIGLTQATSIAALLALLCVIPQDQGQAIPPHAEQGSIFDAIGFPGQMWMANGTYSPVEKNNVISQWDFQQTAVVYTAWHNSITVGPFVEVNGTLDSDGFTYDNQLEPSVGIKVNKLFRVGVISA